VHAAEVRGAVRFFGDAPAEIDRVVLTPDFHKGSLVPVGTVVRARNFCIPQAIGNDVCCGMRLLVTDLPAEALEPHWARIQQRLRGIFFAGERDIPMSPRQREAVLRDGLPGLLATAEDDAATGIWKHFDRHAEEENLGRAHAGGHFETRRLFGFEGFIRSSGKVDGRDPQIGCVGGGNHFVEIQRVDALFDGAAARDWGITKGSVAIMVHSGSVGLGHAIGGHFMDRARELFPTKVKAPRGGFHPLPIAGPLAEEGLFYLDGIMLARRRDILEKYEKRVMEEAPYAYKAVEPVVDSIAEAAIAHKVARLFPLCTMAGPLSVHPVFAGPTAGRDGLRAASRS
jgi:tRNA-splicing ligase RtcB